MDLSKLGRDDVIVASDGEKYTIKSIYSTVHHDNSTVFYRYRVKLVYAGYKSDHINQVTEGVFEKDGVCCETDKGAVIDIVSSNKICSTVETVTTNAKESNVPSSPSDHKPAVRTPRGSIDGRKFPNWKLLAGD